MSKKTLSLLKPKHERQAGSDTAKLFWQAHLSAMVTIQNNLQTVNNNLVTAMARFDDINLADGWAWNADTQQWQRDLV